MNEFYVQAEEDSQFFPTLEGMLRYLQAMERRVSQGEFEDLLYSKDVSQFYYTSTLKEDIDYIIIGLENTMKRYALKEIVEEGKNSQ